MNNQEFAQFTTAKSTYISDGATGSNLQHRGLERGSAPENWLFENPQAIRQLHTDFINAGSDIILTCSFGGNRFRLEHSGMADKVVDVNNKAVQLAREAIGNRIVLLAGSMGPLGQMLKPMGLLELDDAKSAYAEQAEVLSKSGVDLLLIETQFDLQEARAAYEGARSVSDLAIIISFSYDRGTKTMMGVSPTKMVKGLGDLDVAAFGINCGKSLTDNLSCLQELRSSTDKPIWFKPNAGLPQVDELGNAVYSTNPADMAACVPDWIAGGANIIGGCCGTCPEHLSAIADAVRTK